MNKKRSDRAIGCTIKTPVALQIGDVKTDSARPGVFVIDVNFPQDKQVNLQEITFKNYYTAFLTIRIQKREYSTDCSEGSLKWMTCVRNQCLMPDPHTEQRSQDYFSIFRHQMLCEPDNVVTVRLVLRQPSPVWMVFTLEDIRVSQCGEESSEKVLLPWLSHLSSLERPMNLHDCVPDPEKVSMEVQQMWMLTEVMRANQTAARVGRFDVDGCYDINLLSYT
ncbi:nicolin-1 [Latimeria chalumnae]|uniref:Nicolin 1, tubulin polyglutamylase complex subunit n=1 Tax=Latimeria chalumnae TaxID=7897 RepID=H3B616_LATCH|nr:PREDICTED: nicolin-1 [Latimeria chalumnae]XP_005987067.1 PREDICTED: nicolin-1 [Latimeria chalumnae]|eukprot:XP_005987066.1 PREDICTED: nicolin-1 [Latimeria chalumnae]